MAAWLNAGLETSPAGERSEMSMRAMIPAVTDTGHGGAD